MKRVELGSTVPTCPGGSVVRQVLVVGVLSLWLAAGIGHAEAGTIPPTGSILINGGDYSTSNQEVTLTLSASDTGGSGLESMRFRNTTLEPYSDWEPYQSTRVWTLKDGTGTRRVYVQFRDGAGNLSDGNPDSPGDQGYVDEIVLNDKTRPTGSILINGGAHSTSNQEVTLTLSASDAGGSGLESMRFRNTTLEPYSDWEPYQGTRVWTLKDGTGTRRVYVQFKDGAGNFSDAKPNSPGAQGYVDSIVLNDKTRPTGSILINGGAASTTDPVVTLTLSATDTGGSGLESMRFRNTTLEPYSGWEPYQSTRVWTLKDGTGTRRVYVQFKDGAGNFSDGNPNSPGAQGYVDSIVLNDKTPPTGSILINGGDASTGDQEVTLTLSASDTGGSGLESMRFRNTTLEPYSGWEPYQVTRAWTLKDGTGTKRVYVQFSDGAGNLSDGNPNSPGAQGYVDEIVLNDKTPPTGSILINGGDASTGDPEVTLTLSASDTGGSGLESMRFRNTTLEPYSDWEPYQGTRVWTLKDGMGTRRVYVQFSDGAGNLSDGNPNSPGAQGYADEIVLNDKARPTGSILINDGDVSTSGPEVTLTLSASDTGGSGLESMRFRNGDADPYSDWEPYQATRAWTLEDGAGIRVVYAQFRDGAGNLSDADPDEPGAQGYVDSIVSQLAVPTACEECHNGNPDYPQAPNVMGDGIEIAGSSSHTTPKPFDDGTYGFNVNGHGRDADTNSESHGSSIDADCSACHDISVPAGRHLDGVLDGHTPASGNTNPFHLVPGFLNPSPAAEWSAQVTFDNYCFTACHQGRTTDMRHVKDSVPAANAVQLGTHNSYATPLNTPPPHMFYDANITWLGGYNGAPNFALCVSCHNPHGTDVVSTRSDGNNKMVIYRWKQPAVLCNKCHP